MVRAGLIFVFFFYIFVPLRAQENPESNQSIEDLIEEIASNNEAEMDYTQLVEDLFYFAENPINLNNASLDELERLHLLNDFQIRSLLAYSLNSGGFHTKYELQMVQGFDRITIQRLLPFIAIAPRVEPEGFNLSNAFKYGRSQWFSRISSFIETADGYKNGSDSVFEINKNKYYPGNRMRYYTKYKFNYKNKLEFGITAEKDPGEAFFSGAQNKGFDYYSMHVNVSDFGVIETAVLGDYQVKLGQGLILWSGMSTGKSVYVMDIRKRANGLSNYASTDENLFMRGAGVDLTFGNFSSTVFASHKKIDANLQLADSIETHVSSLLNSGIHATPNQVEDKDALSETIAGASVSFQKNLFKIGISGINYAFSEPIKKTDTPENKFEFSGSQNQNFSTDVQFMFKALYLFGEAAVSANGGKAILAGALMELSPQLRTSVLYRNYGIDYQALYANGFAEGSKTQNEKGIYVGIEMHPIKYWKLAAYYDFYQFPWLTSRTDAPAKGNDYLVQADFVPSRSISMYWRYNRGLKETNSDDETTGIIALSSIDKWNARYHINYAVSDTWQLKNRIELSGYSKEVSETAYGYVLYQDISCSPFRLPLTLTARFALFETESYNARIYTYESDVLHAFSIPALYDKGSRFYLLAKYELKNDVTCWVRFAQTWYSQKTEIGSGLDRIDGNTKSEVKVQLRWKF